jgi:histidinol-phosphate aminotransferase
MSDVAAVLALARADIRELSPYAHASWAPELTRLHANELPWPANPGGGAPQNRYPEPQPAELLQALAQYYGVEPAQLVATHGSDEAIDLITRVFCRAGQDAVLTTPPTFGMFAVAAHVQGAAVIEVPLRAEQDFALDTAAVRTAISSNSNVRIVWLCSPNNPSGAHLAEDSIMEVIAAARGRAMVVIDEAYAEFSSRPSLTRLLAQNPHLAILRTMSKAHGLAGARIGAVIAHPQVIDLIRKIILPYTLTSGSIETALAALAPSALAETRRRVRELIASREQLAMDLKASPAIERVWPSDANFLLVRCRPGSRLFERWIEAGLLVRDFRRARGLENCLRITVGTAEQNQRLRAVLGSQP